MGLAADVWTHDSIGRGIAKAVSARGWNAASRRAVVDIVAQQIESVQRGRFGVIDVLVNNAGYGYRAAMPNNSQLFWRHRLLSARMTSGKKRNLRALAYR